MPKQSHKSQMSLQEELALLDSLTTKQLSEMDRKQVIYYAMRAHQVASQLGAFEEKHSNAEVTKMLGELPQKMRIGHMAEMIQAAHQALERSSEERKPRRRTRRGGRRGKSSGQVSHEVIFQAG